MSNRLGYCASGGLQARLGWLCIAVVAAAAGCSQDPDTGEKPDAAPAAEVQGDTGTLDASADPTEATTTTDDSAIGDAPEADTAPVALALLGVTPAQGKASGGQTVELTGTGFDPTLQVLVGATPLDASAVTFVDAGKVVIRMPPHETGLVDLEVVLPGDPARSSKIEKAYLYFNNLVLSSVEPPAGPVAGGTPITLTGSGFSGKAQVLVGGKPAIGVQVVSDDQIIAVTPPGPFGAATVHVIGELGAGVMKKGFFYFAAPTVEALSPGAGPTAGGTKVVLTGKGFTSGVEVSVGAAKASVLAVLSPTRLEIATPPGPAGKADVTALTKYGSGTLAGGFVFTDDKGQAATQLLAIAPAQGPLAGGNAVTLVATGLVSASDTTVLFGNKSAKIESVLPAAHTAVVIAPKGSAAGPITVTLMTTKGTDKAAAGYSYSDALTLASVAPASGTTDGNTKITLKGSGFSKGKPVVKVGALAAGTVVVVSDSEIQAVTPPGSPGYVAVTVQVGSDSAVLPNGFAYTGKQLELYVPFPSSGAQAGGTFVHLYGSGFAPAMQVRFGGKPATHFTFVDPTHITCKTPPGKVGAVDVAVQVGGAEAVLKGAFTYFNPMSQYGGTWGAEIDGAVNITVLDASNSQPVPDAFTMLWTDPTTPYQGFTNADGQITFSGDDISGKQMISASKEAYESASVVLFDATNVTLYIQPIPPPSPGAPPPGTPPPTVSGKVVGLDKYVFVPVGNCGNFIGSVPAPVCSSCASDAQCAAGGPGLGCVDIGENNGKRCLADCSTGQVCTNGFKCQPQQNGPARCVPVKGELTSICVHSKPTILSRDNYPPEGKTFEANAANGYNYKINTSYGEMAIVCFGGYKTPGAVLDPEDANSMQAFTATVMGVKRHLMVGPDKNPTDVHIQLDMPLSQKATVRLDQPKAWSQSATIVTATWAYLVFGGDGVIKMPDQAVKFLSPFTDPEPDRLEIEQLPAALSGNLHDASISLLGLVAELSDEQLPNSISIKNGIKQLSNDSMLRRTPGSDIETIETGIFKNIYGMWGTSPKDVWAVGAQGTLVHWSGGTWTLQASPGKGDLRAVYGTDANHVWVVGQAGTAAAFDGLTWKVLPVVPTTANLTGVYASSDGAGGHAVWATSQQGIYKLQPEAGQPTWKQYNPPVWSNLLAIHGSDKDHIWAVGMYGSIWVWNGQTWKPQSSGTSIALRSVWAISAQSVYAVGEKGQILHCDGTAWKAMQSPVTTTLSSVHATSDQDVWAVGARGAVLHWDGKTWTQINVKDVDKALNTVWTTAQGDLFALGEGELLLGPMLFPPLPDSPAKSGVLKGNTLKWIVDPTTVEPHFNYVTIGIPGMGPDTPVWNIMTKGSVDQVELPDFPAIQGTPGIPKGTTLRLSIIRGYKEGFDIDAYDLSDLDNLTWRSWSMHSFFFTRQ